MALRFLFAALVMACQAGAGPIDGSTNDVPTGSCCSPIAQFGCSAVEKCVLSSTGCSNKVACVPDGTVASGDQCEVQPDDCKRGAMCVDGRCRSFCSALQDTCDVGLCPPPAGDIHVCSKSCDPRSPMCESGDECYLPLDATSETPGCLSVGTLSEGQECEYPNDCGTGLTCSRESSGRIGVCRLRCLTTQPVCDLGYVCHERKALDGYGVCRPE